MKGNERKCIEINMKRLKSPFQVDPVRVTSNSCAAAVWTLAKASVSPAGTSSQTKEGLSKTAFGLVAKKD